MKIEIPVVINYIYTEENHQKAQIMEQLVSRKLKEPAYVSLLNDVIDTCVEDIVNNY